MGGKTSLTTAGANLVWEAAWTKKTLVVRQQIPEVTAALVHQVPGHVSTALLIGQNQTWKTIGSQCKCWSIGIMCVW